MFRFVIALVIVASVVAFAPTRMATRQNMQMSALNEFQSKFSKAMGIAALGVTLMGPIAANADGAVSPSSIYRVRNTYGTRIVDLAPAVEKGDFAAFEDKKILNAFDLFISGSNAQKSTIAKQRCSAEKAIQAKIYAAVKAKDSSKLKSEYAEFIKVADLKSEYKKGELGQSDSSGYSPVYKSDRWYIYQR